MSTKQFLQKDLQTSASKRRRRARARAARGRLLPGALSAGAALGVGLSASEASAASYEVTNLDDSGAGSLRQAILDANAMPGADIITFQAGLTGTITLTSGELRVADSVDIQGPGADVLAVSGNDASRVFYAYSAAATLDVAISGLTVTHGAANLGGGIRNMDEHLVLDGVVLDSNASTGKGGGLWADGFNMQLTINNSVISGNTAGDDGGGVYIEDTGATLQFTGTRITGNTSAASGGGIYFYDPDTDIVIERSTISGNTCATTGGGIYLYNMDAGVLTIRDTTISGNTAGSGGGGAFFYSADDQVAIENSTISGNTTTTGDGGGVYIYGLYGVGVTLAHSTIAGNTCGGNGGGVFVASGSLTLDHTIVADNTATTADPDISGAFALKSSLVEAAGAATIVDNGGNVLGSDPQLAALADNGGPTQTQLPAATSPAVDSGDPSFAAPPDADQRGLTRVIGAAIDIGAVERNPGTIVLASDTASVVEGAGTVTITASRVGGFDGEVAVTLGSIDGTATAAGDFTAPSGTLTWANQDSADKSFTITITDDAVVEDAESFEATIADPTAGAQLGGVTSTAVTITDDDVVVDAGSTQDAGMMDASTGSGDAGDVSAGGTGGAGDPTTGGTGGSAGGAGSNAKPDAGIGVGTTGSAGNGMAGSGSSSTGDAAVADSDAGMGGGGADDGCGCSTVGHTAPTAKGVWSTALVGLAAFVARRRRRGKRAA